jgi:hypothetical protein
MLTVQTNHVCFIMPGYEINVRSCPHVPVEYRNPDRPDTPHPGVQIPEAALIVLRPSLLFRTGVRVLMGNPQSLHS